MTEKRYGCGFHQSDLLPTGGGAGGAGTFNGCVMGEGADRLPQYLIQYTPVPGSPREMYFCPFAEIPILAPGIPALHPIPFLESVERNGPHRSVRRSRQPISLRLCVSPVRHRVTRI